MRNLVSSLLVLIILLYNISYTFPKLLKIGEKHIGIEYNMFWGSGDSDLISAELENFAKGKFKTVETDFFNSDFSIQYTIYNKLVLRYTYISLNTNIDGPVGPDLGYKFGDSESADWDFKETEYKYYNQSGLQNISHIFSIGYPFTITTIKKYPFWGIKSGFPIEMIIFSGLSFQTSSEMDLYLWSTGFLDWDFMTEHEWYIENRNINKTIKLSLGISIPAFIQISLFHTGEDLRLMFGVGI